MTTWIVPNAIAGWDKWEFRQGKASCTERAIAIKGKDFSSSTMVALPVADVLTYPQMAPPVDQETLRSMVFLELEQRLSGKVLSEAGWADALIHQGEGENAHASYVIDNSVIDYKTSFRQCQFDYSARLRSVTDDAFIVWQEWGSWVIACCHQGVVFYAEVLGEELPQNLASTLQVISMRFMMTGVPYTPEKVIFSGELAESSAVVLEELVKAEWQVESRSEFSPTLPTDQLGYTPEYVVEWKAAKKVAKQRSLALSVLGVFCLIGVAFLWFQRWQVQQELDKYQAVVDQHSPMQVANEEFEMKRDELWPMWTSEWPLVLMQRCAENMPAGYSGKLTIETLKINGDRISLKGKSKSDKELNELAKLLRKDKRFIDFDWRVNDAKRSPDQSYWSFKIEGLRKDEVEEGEES